MFYDSGIPRTNDSLLTKSVIVAAQVDPEGASLGLVDYWRNSAIFLPPVMYILHQIRVL